MGYFYLKSYFINQFDDSLSNFVKVSRIFNLLTSITYVFQLFARLVQYWTEFSNLNWNLFLKSEKDY